MLCINWSYNVDIKDRQQGPQSLLSEVLDYGLSEWTNMSGGYGPNTGLHLL